MNVFLLLACFGMQCLSTRASSLDSSFPLTLRKLSHQHNHPYNAGFTDLPKSVQCPGYTPPPVVKKTCAPFSFNLTCTSSSVLTPTSVHASKPTSRSEEDEKKKEKDEQDECPAQLRQILQRIESDESTWNCLTMRAASSSATPSDPLNQRDTDDATDQPEGASKQDVQEPQGGKGGAEQIKSTVLLPSVDVHCHVENWLPIWLNNTAWNASGATPSATGGLVGGEWAFGTQLDACLE